MISTLEIATKGNRAMYSLTFIRATDRQGRELLICVRSNPLTGRVEWADDVVCIPQVAFRA